MFVAQRLFAVHAVLDRDGDTGGDLFHERNHIVGVDRARTAAEREDADLPVRSRQGQPRRHLSTVRANEFERRMQRSLVGDGNDRSLLCFPDRPGGCVWVERGDGDGRRHVARLQHDQAHESGRLLVDDEGEIVERNQRTQFVSEHLDELANGLMAGERLRDTQQRVVSGEASRDERGLVGHE